MSTSHAGRRHRTPAQDVGQHGGALHVLHQQWDHGGQLVFAQRVAQCAGPMYVVDGWMSVLVVRQVDVFHREHRELVRTIRISSVFHVPGDREQLR